MGLEAKKLLSSHKGVHFREALDQSARAGSERFWFQARQDKRRNTLCISRLGCRSLGAKDPLSSRRRLVQSFPH